MSSGFLAIWNDLVPETEHAYLHWHLETHVPERMALAGVRRARRFVALDDRTERYFTCFDLTNPGVLESEGYLALVNQPAPETERLMDAVRNFHRGGGTRLGSGDVRSGGAAATVRLDVDRRFTPDRLAADLRALSEPAGGELGLVNWDVLVTTRLASDSSAERRIRSRNTDDASFDAAVVLECVGPDEARAVVDAAEKVLTDLDGVQALASGTYRLQVEWR